MAHFVLGRDPDHDGYYDFIQNIVTMDVTENKYFAQQFEDKDLLLLDLNYLRQYGFFPIPITRLGLRIANEYRTVKPLNPFKLLVPPARKPRPPMPPVPSKPAMPPRPAAMGGPAKPAAVRVKAPAVPKAPVIPAPPAAPAAPAPARGPRPKGPTGGRR